jgi:2-polyprenyl-3-methyl-5-hydroxy-6-metoxy-1,4-benzoquinol methylase
MSTLHLDPDQRTPAYWDALYKAEHGAPDPSPFEWSMLRVYTSARPGMRVIDVGCGRGRLAAHMAAWGLTVTGYDFSRVAIEDAQTKHSPLWEELTFVRHDFDTDPIPPDLRPNSVDVITCRHSLEFLDQTRFLTDAARWLVPGGARRSPRTSATIWLRRRRSTG